MTTVYIEGSHEAYSECHPPGIESSIKIGSGGLRIAGYEDRKGNLPTFSCSKDSKKVNFLSVWTPPFYEQTDVLMSNVSFSQVVVSLIGPRLTVHLSRVSFHNSVLLSSSPNCEMLNISFEEVKFTTNGPLPFSVTFSPVNKDITDQLLTKVLSAGACLYCKKSHIHQ